jgi:hypothetical protein
MPRFIRKQGLCDSQLSLTLRVRFLRCYPLWLLSLPSNSKGRRMELPSNSKEGQWDWVYLVQASDGGVNTEESSPSLCQSPTCVKPWINLMNEG